MFKRTNADVKAVNRQSRGVIARAEVQFENGNGTGNRPTAAFDADILPVSSTGYSDHRLLQVPAFPPRQDKPEPLPNEIMAWNEVVEPKE